MPLQYAVTGGLSAVESGLRVTSRGLALGVTGMQATMQGFEASRRSLDLFVEDPLLVTEAPRATDIALTTAPIVTGIARDQRRETSSAQRERRGQQIRSADRKSVV